MRPRGRPHLGHFTDTKASTRLRWCHNWYAWCRALYFEATNHVLLRWGMCHFKEFLGKPGPAMSDNLWPGSWRDVKYHLNYTLGRFDKGTIMLRKKSFCKQDSAIRITGVFAAPYIIQTFYIIHTPVKRWCEWEYWHSVTTQRVGTIKNTCHMVSIWPTAL